jgi:hypothetical protein
VKVLYWPQLSMRSYEDNTWLVPSDAQFTKMLAYVEALPEEWEWTFCMPAPDQTDNSFAVMLPKNTKFVWNEWADNVLEMRYHFDMRWAKRLLERDFDVMLNEVPEHARAWRTAQRAAGRDFPIISMVEHVDIYVQTRVPASVGYHMRQVDGSLVSDAVAFPLAGMKDEWMKAAKDVISQDVYDMLLGKELVDERMPVWQAIFSPREVMRAQGDEYKKPEERKKPIVNFISRLSDDQRTNYKAFFDVVNDLRNKGRESFDLWIANPNSALSDQKIAELVSLRDDDVISYAQRGRGEYLNRLWKSDIVPILYPQSHIYSVGYCEAIIAMNVVITTRGPLGEECAGVQVSDSSVAEITKGLTEAIDVIRLSAPDFLAKQEEWIMSERTVEANISKVRKTIEEVAGGTLAA